MIIIAGLMGGLGNQLFEYAAGRALAHARGARLLLDISSYDTDHLGRQYRLDRFHVRAEQATTADVQRVTRQGQRDLVSRVWRRIERGLPSYWRSVFVDREEGSDSELFRIRRSVVLRGYWQSERYFQSIGPLLRQELTLRAPPEGPNAELAQEITDRDAVSLHLRRGDYVANNSHVVLSSAYYHAAVARIGRETLDAHYYVFSDDIPWCRQHLDLALPMTFVDHNGPEADYEDLRLMSQCKHHIIANSSFSWWGAWLGQRPGQVVVAPQEWFRDPARTTRDLIPDRWERL